MYRFQILLLLTFLLPAHLQAQPGRVSLASVQVGETWSDHPLVQTIRNQGYLTLQDREKLLDKRFPADRAWAAIDVLGVDGIQRHAVEQFIVQGLAARLSIGTSGALTPRDIETNQLDARQALVLGWVRALISQDDPKRLNRRSNRMLEAGALQLLEIAVQKSPGVQTAHLAYGLVQATVHPNCDHALKLAKAARDPGQQSVRLAMAERVNAIATTLGRSCPAKDLALFTPAIQLPPPLPEAAPAGDRAPTAKQLGVQTHPCEPFVVTAPVFRGWLNDPAIKHAATGMRLDQPLLEDTLRRDLTGDLAIALLNASLLAARQSPEELAKITWQTLALRHGIKTNPEGTPLALNALTPQEAMVYGYARSVETTTCTPLGDPQDARTFAPVSLLSAARGKLPSAAALGPILAFGHEIDIERQVDRCRPQDLADTLRGIVLKANIPQAARDPLVQALDTVIAQCKATRAQP